MDFIKNYKVLAVAWLVIQPRSWAHSFSLTVPMNLAALIANIISVFICFSIIQIQRAKNNSMLENCKEIKREAKMKCLEKTRDDTDLKKTVMLLDKTIDCYINLLYISTVRGFPDYIKRSMDSSKDANQSYKDPN